MPKTTSKPAAAAQSRPQVWIELEKPRDEAHAEELCALANNMLRRLNDGTASESKFFWDKRKQQYAYGGPMGYVELPERGSWFNLAHLGRPLEVTA